MVSPILSPRTAFGFEVKHDGHSQLVTFPRTNGNVASLQAPLEVVANPGTYTPTLSIQLTNPWFVILTNPAEPGSPRAPAPTRVLDAQRLHSSQLTPV